MVNERVSSGGCMASCPGLAWDSGWWATLAGSCACTWELPTASELSLLRSVAVWGDTLSSQIAFLPLMQVAWNVVGGRRSTSFHAGTACLD